VKQTDARTVLHEVADPLADLLDERRASNPGGTHKTLMHPRAQVVQTDGAAALPEGMTAWVDVGAVMQAVGCSRSKAHEFLRAASGRQAGTANSFACP
jgi:hypothetical protein